MNDRFRFRAWHKDFDGSYEMIYEVQATYDFGCRAGCPGADEDCFQDVLDNNDYIVMQSTGLKDKNDKLIYEGDIVRYTCPAEYCSDGLHKCQDCCSDEIASIHFDKEQAMFTYRSEIDQCSLTDNINTEEDLEVIGNIYENPELLEG